MRIELSRPGYPVRSFEVVDKIPAGYKVWCINREGLEGYLPVCQTVTGFKVNTTTLKAVPMPESKAQLVSMAAMRYGAESVEDAEKILQRPSGKSRRFIFRALDILLKYSEKPGKNSRT